LISALDEWMIGKDILEKIGKKWSRHLSRRTDENHEQESRLLVSWPRFEPSTYRRQVWSIGFTVIFFLSLWPYSPVDYGPTAPVDYGPTALWTMALQPCGLCPYSPVDYDPTAPVDYGRFFCFLIYIESVELLGWGICPSQGLYLHAEQHKHRINAHRHPWLEWDSNPRFQC
jgi:hypothetical protein